MKEEYDVVVIGGGPAGTTAGRYAAENGASVLVVEKRDEIGAPKRCGEGLSSHAMELIGIKPEPTWAIQELEGAYVYAPSGKSVEARFTETAGYIIERKMFDKKLAYMAVDAGAEVLAGTRATSLIKEDGKITGVELLTFDEQKVKAKAKVVIGADGVESLTARWAGLNSSHKLTDICSSFQFEMGGLKLRDPHMLEIYMGNKVAPGGYVWVFPKGENRANVGIGLRANLPGRAYKYLVDFIKNHPGLKNGSVIEINGGGVPVGEPLETLVTDGFMVIGDAAHQVNAIHGGGIKEAIIAGRIAGKVAAEAVKKGDASKEVLKKYEDEWYSTEGNNLKRIVKLRRVVEQLSDDDLNFLAENIDGDTIIKLTQASKFTALAKILSKRPSLLRYVPLLLK